MFVVMGSSHHAVVDIFSVWKRACLHLLGSNCSSIGSVCSSKVWMQETLRYN
jgi:hypothetical protein